MRLRTQRKAIYAAMGLTVLALTSGFALASASLSLSPVTSQQGARSTTVSSVTGMDVLGEANLTIMDPTTYSELTSCHDGACDVTNGGAATCVGALPTFLAKCNGTEYVEEINSTTNTGVAFKGTLTLTMYVTVGGDTYAGATELYTDTGSVAQETITQAFVVGNLSTGPLDVTNVVIVADVA